MSSKFLRFCFLASLALIFDQAKAQSPTDPAMGFNIFTKGDLTVMPNEIEGPVAVGGNFYSNQYQITFNKSHGVFFVDGVSIGLAVRGAVKLNSNSLKVDGGNYIKIGNGLPNDPNFTNLKVWYTDANGHDPGGAMRITAENGGYDSSPQITINTGPTGFKSNYTVSASNNPVFENVFGTGANQIDIDGAFMALIKKSMQLKDLADNLPIRKENQSTIPGHELGPYLTTGIFDQNPVIKVNPDGLNVLTVSAAVWNSIQNINFADFPAGEQLGTTAAQYAASGKKFGLIINIVDFPTFCAANGGSNEIRFPNYGLSDAQSNLIIYNFPDATKGLTLRGNLIWGTVLAPQADVVKRNNGNLVGQVIAKSFIHNGDEIHFRPFLPTVADPIEDAIEVVATSLCSKNAGYLDYTVTPNYDTKGKKVKIEWIDSENKVIQEDIDQELTGRILFPGFALDADGNGAAWPGWEKKNGKWEEVIDRYGSLRESGATIRVTIDPWKIIDITFPESTTTCFTSPPPSNTLPVTLSSFTANNDNCNAKLKWVVSEAKDFSHFVVERSADAKTFSPLARIDFKAGKSEYSFSDSPFASETIPAKYYYYRLQQVDTDETFEYSSIRSIAAGTCDARLSVDFYPNPTQDEVNVKSFSPVKKLEIFTLGGKKVYQLMPNLNATEVSVNVQAFAQGLYIINVVNEEGKYSSKLLKK
ncbi:choice-of-anchor A family protein [Dyadobacter arcticus]|uniref:Choice-of-anchor A domain-containing protein n=1 Tax=Dyadobacter arcticus TaxID=1078754 RepID=A0ABX0UQ27_9BACT|nr:choice-of-anchor A family protein [Dyadobacter arcticus]NIJ55097.1 choice-of-anchor A domain-containing protein [Dyadobacter arcticus]